MTKRQEIDQAVLSSIEFLEKGKVKPFARTIFTFVNGKKSSPYYKSIFVKHKKVYSHNFVITEDDITASLARLFKSGDIKIKENSDGKIFYSFVKPKKAKQSSSRKRKIAKKAKISRTVKNSDSSVSFYQSATPTERKILNEFRRLIKELLPDHKLVNDRPYMYSFVPKSGSFEAQNRVWISRDSKTRKLKLHYKKELGGNESEPLDLTTQRKKDEAWRILRITYDDSSDNLKKIKYRLDNKDKFDEYKSKNVKTIELMPHQKAGVELAKIYNKFAFFYDTGTGKTIMSLEIMAEKHNLNGTKFLVVAPKALIKAGWMEDAEYFPNMRLLPLSTNMSREDYARIYDHWRLKEGKSRLYTNDDDYLINKIEKAEYQRIKYELFNKADHYIVNIDKIRKPKTGNELLKNTGVNGLIIDESVTIKNYGTSNAKRMRVFAKKMDYIYLLSGKPAPNNTIDYYSQMILVDPDTFNIPFGAFVKKYYKQTAYGKYVDKNDRTRKIVAKMVGNRSLIIKKEECLDDLPPTTHQKVSVTASNKTLSFYKSVLNNFIAEIVDIDGNNVQSKRTSRIASIMKLREIASGFYLDEQQDPHRIDESKFDAMLKLIEEIGLNDNGKQNQVLIWCTFKYEIEQLKEKLIKEGYKVVTAYSETKGKTHDNIMTFKKGEADIMIAHPQTLKYGITFTNCHYCIFNSMSYSYDNYYQAHDRIYRKGQKNECFYYHMITENTIDEIIYKCVINKSDKSRLFEQLIKSASIFGYNKNQIDEILKKAKSMKYTVNNDVIVGVGGSIK